MNVLSSRFALPVLPALLFLAVGAIGFGPLRAASPEDPALIQSALSSSQSWLAEIDSGKYDESYDQGCTAFRNKVTRDQWNTVLKALRPPLGAVLSRKVATYAYKPDGYEGLEGECMVIRYTTAFAKVPTDLELVVLKREDGQWRGAGYNAQPQGDQPPDADSPPPADAQTEVNQQSAR